MRKLIALSLLLTLAGCSHTNSTQPSITKSKYETYVSVGQQFPISQLTSTSGDKIDLNTNDKRKLVLLFATWCSDSQRTISQIMQSPLAQQDDLQIVGIGREENTESLEQFANKYRTNFPLVADAERKIYSQFANAGVPRLILLDKNNKIVKTIIGEMPNTIDYIVW